MRRETIAPNPVTINAIVPGSGTALACPLKEIGFVGQQLSLPTHPKNIEKVSPFKIPVCGLRVCLTPENRISTEPFAKVFVEQLWNMLARQVMSAADTPVSINVSEVQFFPLVFVKNSAPLPPLGELKVKLMPTSVHPFGGHANGLSGLAP